MSITISQVIKHLEVLYPKHLAYDKDPIGLHVGNSNRQLTSVLVTLDVTLEVVEEAIKLGANLIVAHHPFIYRPLSQINTNTPKGKIIEYCLKHDICIYSMHTNYDIGKNGMNDLMADLLNLNGTRPLVATKREAYSKVAIYVPLTHAEVVKEALGNAGAGQIGQYSHCIFESQGTGSFMPLPGSQPYLGHVLELESVEEVKVEAVVQSSLVHQVIAMVKGVHPYEEMAYDVYSLDVTMPDAQYGLGRIGTLSETMLVTDYIEYIKKQFNLSHVRFVGKLDKKIKTVAVIGGSGGSYIHSAKSQKADLFVTGDLGYHDACDALDIGLNVLDIGHYAEVVMKQHVASLINEAFASQATAEIAKASTMTKDPYCVL